MLVTLLRVALVLLLLLLTHQLWYGEGGILRRNALQARIAELQQQNEALAQRNERLAAEIRELREGGPVVEEHARRLFNWVREDELLFLLPRPATGQ